MKRPVARRGGAVFDITSRVGELLRNGTDGTKGLYLKEVGGPVLASLEENWVFEPASAMKAVHH